ICDCASHFSHTGLPEISVVETCQAIYKEQIAAIELPMYKSAGKPVHRFSSPVWLIPDLAVSKTQCLVQCGGVACVYCEMPWLGSLGFHLRYGKDFGRRTPRHGASALALRADPPPRRRKPYLPSTCGFSTPRRPGVHFHSAFSANW